MLALGVFAWSACASAHDIPSDATVQAIVRPAGKELFVAVRLPLMAIRDIECPQRGPGYLDIQRAEPCLRAGAKTWVADLIEMYQGTAPLAPPQIVAVRASLPSDPSFRSYDEAVAEITGAQLPPETNLYWGQAMLDVLLRYEASPRGTFSIHPHFDDLALRVVTALRFLTPGGAIRAYEFIGDPGLVRLDPRWDQAALRFVHMGFLHILDGTDHLLFLFCLVIPFRKFRALIPIITSFTVAHSITLLASAYGLAPGALWFPPLIEALIAASIVYMALENIVGSTGLQRRWMITFGFGLVHGFGFSFALRQTLQFAGSHLLTSLLSFNLGVELGQLLVLCVMIPLLHLFFRYAVAERMGTIILSALVAHTGWHWMIDRAETLRQFSFSWPSLNAAFFVVLTRWLMLMVILGGLAWLGRMGADRWRRGLGAGAEEKGLGPAIAGKELNSQAGGGAV